MQEEEKTLAAQAAEIAASHGLRPDAARTLPPPVAESESDLAAQFAQITDPAARSAFFKQHKAAIKSAGFHRQN
jgi:hypothetical protein